MSSMYEQWNVRKGFISRVVAEFGREPAEAPPAAVLEAGLANEHFARMILQNQDKTFTVRAAYALIGGDNAVVTANVRRLKALLPPTAPSKGDNAMQALIQEIREEERRRSAVREEEQEEFYLAKIDVIEKQHAADHDSIIAKEARTQAQNELLANDNNKLCADIKELRQRERELNNSYTQAQSNLRGSESKVAGMQQLLDEKDRSLNTMQETSDKMMNSYAKQLTAKVDEVDEYQIAQQKHINEISALRNALEEQGERLTKEVTAQRESLATSHNELAEVTEKLEQKNLKLNEHFTLDSIKREMDSSLAVLEPMGPLIGSLVASKKTGVLDIKSIIREINSVDGKVADMNASVQKLLKAGQS